MLKQFKQKWKKMLVRRQTIRELSALSDRELKDLGISRCDIEHIA